MQLAFFVGGLLPCATAPLRSSYCGDANSFFLCWDDNDCKTLVCFVYWFFGSEYRRYTKDACRDLHVFPWEAVMCGCCVHQGGRGHILSQVSAARLFCSDWMHDCFDLHLVGKVYARPGAFVTMDEQCCFNRLRPRAM